MTGLAEKVRFLSDPAAYGGQTERVEARETHMSWVFLTDRRVYKLKKPVKRPHLDFSTLRKRHLNCAEELRLNRRLAGDIYRAIVPLRRGADGALTLSGKGRVVDWLVEMDRLPQEMMLDMRILNGRLTRLGVEKAAIVLAGFYAAGAGVEDGAAVYLRHVEQELPIIKDVLQRREFGLSAAAQEAFTAVEGCLDAVRPLLQRRAERGWIVEGHGDLRPEHVCLEKVPKIIDCLEFDRTMRIVDPYDEVNYLGLECEILGVPWVRPLLLQRLGDRIGHPPEPALLGLYGAFRMLLRARLCIAHLLETPVRHPKKWRPLALRYLALADRESLSLPSREDRRSSRSRAGV